MSYSSKRHSATQFARRGTSSVVWLALAIVSLLSLLTFSAFDTSWRLQAVPELPVHNLLGVFGANLSQLLFFLLGAAAWLVPALFLLEGLARIFPMHRRFGGLVRLLVSICLLMLGVMAHATILLLEQQSVSALLPALSAPLLLMIPELYLWAALVAQTLLIALGLWFVWPLSWQVTTSWLTSSFSSTVVLNRSSAEGALHTHALQTQSAAESVPTKSNVSAATLDFLKSHAPPINSATGLAGSQSERERLGADESSFAASDAPNQWVVDSSADLAGVDETDEQWGGFADFEPEPTQVSADQLIGSTASGVKSATSLAETHSTANPPSDRQLQREPSSQPNSQSQSRAFATAEHRAKLSSLPESHLLDAAPVQQLDTHDPEKLAYLSELLQEKLQEFGVKSKVVSAKPGPVITRFEVDLAPGVKASKVSGISRDLARSLSMATVRVVEVIPGKPYIGIEVPNQTREMVTFKQMMDSEPFRQNKNELCMAIGKNISGKPTVFDLAKAPHLLVAGTTGSGKSVTVNVMLLSMLFKYTPEELRLILIDPKQLELANYSDIPHLLTPVVTDMKDAASSLSWCVKEMERRYKLMAFMKVRKLSDYNKKLKAAEQNGEDFLDPTWRPNDSVSVDRAPRLQPMPFIVVIADEFADMIMQVGKQAEELITRLAQKSRAAGIHLVLATQRPSVDVITGLIKANIPTRMALRVNSRVDSRTILDQGGAEDMLGHGDMLFLGPGKIEPERVHSAFVSDDEVNRVCDAWRERGAPDYVDEVLEAFDENATDTSSGSGGTSAEDDDLYDQAVAFVMESKKVSISSIQRKFSIGFNRAARIVDGMQEAGLVSSADKTGKREILM